jgi:hypothetical protein
MQIHVHAKVKDSNRTRIQAHTRFRAFDKYKPLYRNQNVKTDFSAGKRGLHESTFVGHRVYQPSILECSGGKLCSG